MKANLIFIGSILLAGLMGAMITCTNPRLPKGSIARNKKTCPSDVHPINTIKDAGPPAALDTVLGKVMFDRDGKVIGILFSTPEGDYCEHTRGKPSGFFISGHAEQQWDRTDHAFNR